MPGQNLFEQLMRAPAPPASEGPDLSLPPCVFISYRHEQQDTALARESATLLTALGFDIFFDEQDLCLKRAQAAEEGEGEAVAICIDDGLDRSTALLGVITPNTFSSPWNYGPNCSWACTTAGRRTLLTG